MKVDKEFLPQRADVVGVYCGNLIYYLGLWTGVKGIESIETLSGETKILNDIRAIYNLSAGVGMLRGLSGTIALDLETYSNWISFTDWGGILSWYLSTHAVEHPGWIGFATKDYDYDVVDLSVEAHNLSDGRLL